MRRKARPMGLWLGSLLALAVAGGGIGVLRAQQPMPNDSTDGESVLPRKAQPAQPAAKPQDPNQTVESGKVIRVPSNLVETPVTVTDSKGEFVFDLNENDFHILDNGVPQRIENFVQETRPLAVVVLIQSNEFMKPLLPQLRPLAPLISSLLLGPQGTVAVLTFSDRVSVAQDFSSSGDRLAETLKGLGTQGTEERLNDGLARAIALLEQRPSSERRIIVAFSDGFDSGSETSEEDLVQRATKAEVTIYGLGFSRTQAMFKEKPHDSGPSALDQQVTRPTPPNSPPTPTVADNTYGTHGAGNSVLSAAAALIHSTLGTPALDTYAKYTGGVFYSHWSEKALQEQLSRMASEIHSQYELAYVPDTPYQPGFHKIEVQVRRPGVKVRTRAGYIYAASKP
jgi:VWFA-related protein